jgi:hypothetical protein
LEHPAPPAAHAAITAIDSPRTMARVCSILPGAFHSCLRGVSAPVAKLRHRCHAFDEIGDRSARNPPDTPAVTVARRLLWVRAGGDAMIQISRAGAVAVAAAILASVSGCGVDVTVEDDFGDIEAGQPARLYAVGTRVGLEMRRADGEPIRGWRGHLEEGGVASVIDKWVEDDSELHVDLAINAPGDTAFVIEQSGSAIARVPIRAAHATRVHLIDHALQRAQAVSEDIGDALPVIAGQTVAVEIRYATDDGERAFGKDLVEVSDPETMSVWEQSDLAGATREYVLFEAPAPGTTRALSLSVNGEPVRTLHARSIDPAEIDSLELVGDRNEETAEAGDRLCAALVAYDRDGRRIFGPPASWSVDGITLDAPAGRIFIDPDNDGDDPEISTAPPADLLCYAAAPEGPVHVVRAAAGAAQIGGELRGDDFFADSSVPSFTGCATVPGSRGGAGWGAAAALAALALALRRRATARGRRACRTAPAAD